MMDGVLRQWGWIGLVAVLLVVGLGREGRAQSLEWRGFEAALAAADSTGRFVMVAVSAPWRGWCHKMKTEVYPSAGVTRCLADDFVVTRLNRDDTETRYRYQGRRRTPRALASAFRADGVPATVLLSPQGDYLLHLSGFMESEALRTVLAYLATGAYRRTSFEDFRADSVGCAGGEG
jgi:thioredoxin-related protein